MGTAEGGLDQGTEPTPDASRPAPPTSGASRSGASRPSPTDPHGREEVADPQAQLAAADERERRSRDLHDLVLQRLFGLAATLSALSSSTSDARTAQRLEACVDDLDQTIRAIRDGILQQTPLQDDRPGCRPNPPAAVVALAQSVMAGTVEGPAAVGRAVTAEAAGTQRQR